MPNLREYNSPQIIDIAILKYLLEKEPQFCTINVLQLEKLT